jgi:hypothetical protein
MATTLGIIIVLGMLALVTLACVEVKIKITVEDNHVDRHP